jgi:glycosyltransferase involved in cell wall biosynthesis
MTAGGMKGYMRIGFDCAKLAKGTGKSIGIYNVARSVVTNLVGKLPEGYELVVFGNEKNRCDFDVEGVEFVLTDLDITSKKEILLWELFRVNSYIKKYHIDEIVFPRGFTSWFCPVKDVIIVHDLIPFYYHTHYPEVLGKLQNAYIMFRLKQSIRLAKKVITISQYSYQDIVKMVPAAAGKTTVILHGFDRRRDRYEVQPAKEEYIIGVTSALPHKNAKGIVSAYLEYFKMTEKPAKLVLAGIESLDAAGINVDVRARAYIECRKYLEDQEYFTLFKNAKVLVFLSYIEGFGLPPLEAMELGVPVICSNASSLPEVINDAGILVDPDDSKAAAEALLKVLSDEEYRKDLIFNGYVNLNSFRWEDKIQEYIKVLVGE